MKSDTRLILRFVAPSMKLNKGVRRGRVKALKIDSAIGTRVEIDQLQTMPEIQLLFITLVVVVEADLTRL